MTYTKKWVLPYLYRQKQNSILKMHTFSEPNDPNLNRIHYGKYIIYIDMQYNNQS